MTQTFVMRNDRLVPRRLARIMDEERAWADHAVRVEKYSALIFLWLICACASATVYLGLQ